MRLLIQAVGPRVSHYYDRPWAASEDRQGERGRHRAERSRPRRRRQVSRRVTAPCTCCRPSPPRSTTSSSPSISARARATWWWCRSSTAILRALPRRWRRRPRRCRACGSRTCAISAIRCPSTFGPTRWRVTPRSSSCVCSAGSTGGAMASRRLSAMAQENGIALAVLPGEDRNDERLFAASTLPEEELSALLKYFREGGPQNLQAPVAPARAPCGRDPRGAGAAERAAHGRLCAGQGRRTARDADVFARPGTGRGAGDLLPVGAACGRHRADR